MYFNKKNSLEINGFTIIEMLVTLSIVVIATGLVMLKYASFNSSVLLNNQAYAIGFDIRETQSISISVRGAGGEFRQEYGMYFDISTPNQYQLFQDIGDTKPVQYDDGEEIGDPVIIDPRYTIVDICGTTLTNPIVRHCYSEGDGYPANVSVAFARPDFEAVMYGDNMGQLSVAEITIAGDIDSTFSKTILVSNTGQITIQ